MSADVRDEQRATAAQQYRMLHDIYVLLDDGDRRVLDGFGLTTSQYSVLVLLDEEEGHRLTTVSDGLLRARSTITRIVDQLEALGLVQREDDPDDRRAQRVMLTPTGAERRRVAMDAHQRSLARRLASLTPSEHDQLGRLLGKLRGGLRADLDSSNHR
jgi:DNA-binding MarR family transcriptional regulator